MSRLLSTLCLYRAGYDFKRLFTISEYYDRDRAAFYAALQGVRRAEMDLTGWLEFFVTGLSASSRRLAIGPPTRCDTTDGSAASCDEL